MISTVVPRAKPVTNSGDKIRRSQGAFSTILEQLKEKVEESIKSGGYETVQLTLRITPNSGIDTYDLLSGGGPLKVA